MSRRASGPTAALLTALLGGALIGSALAGCTTGGADGPGGTAVATTPRATGRTAAPSPPPPPGFSGTTHPLPSGRALTNDPLLYRQVRLTSCAATRHGWAASGTASNASSAKAGYTVLVLFTDAQGRDVDSAAARVTVAAGGTGSWRAARSFAAPAGTRCVVRAVRAAAAR